MFEVGRAVIVTSSDGPPLVFGLTCSTLPPLVFGRGTSGFVSARNGPGDISLLKDDGSLERGEVCTGVANLPTLDDGVDGGGETGSSLSTSVLLCTNGGRWGDARWGEGCLERSGDEGSFCGVLSRLVKSDSELRRFFLGGPVGMKLGCSPIVDSPRLLLDGVRPRAGIDGISPNP